VTAAALLGIALLLAAPDRDGTAPGPTPEGATGLSLDAHRDRAAAEAGAGDEGVRALVRRAAAPSRRERRAALEALGTLTEGSVPEGTLEAALRSLGAGDAEERAAAVRALLACGAPARAALEALASPEGPPSVLPAVARGRAEDALHSFRRREIEREFLATWAPEDGQYRGMYAALARHGAFGARVLTAIALDRRVAGADLLGYGPYAWIEAPGPDRDRAEIRDRALTALEDAGDGESLERLRSILRKSPAVELFDESDDDPIPAGVDDTVRRTLATLGDPEPIREVIRLCEEGGRLEGRSRLGGVWTTTIEARRCASAHGTLGDCAYLDARTRAEHRDRCVDLLEASLALKRAAGLPIDGVEYYNLACARARRNDEAERDRAVALEQLRTSVLTYAVSADWLARDGDLASLHGDPRFERLVAQLRAREKALEDAMKGR
jgi:hypothetical protein